MLRHLVVAADLAIVIDPTARATVISGMRSLEVDAWLLPTIPLPPVISSATFSFDDGASSPSAVSFYDQSLDSLLIDSRLPHSTALLAPRLLHMLSELRPSSRDKRSARLIDPPHRWKPGNVIPSNIALISVAQHSRLSEGKCPRSGVRANGRPPPQ
jgi:hypothetical protein